jgi:hypothetical protein
MDRSSPHFGRGSVAVCRWFRPAMGSPAVRWLSVLRLAWSIARSSVFERTSVAFTSRCARLVFVLLLYSVAPFGDFAPVHAQTAARGVLARNGRHDLTKAQPARDARHVASCAELECHRVSTLRSGTRHALFYAIMHRDSPNGDDTTSNDPDDDDDNDSSHDLRFDSDTDQPIMAMSGEVFPTLDTLIVEIATCWPEFPSYPSIPAGVRLLC